MRICAENYPFFQVFSGFLPQNYSYTRFLPLFLRRAIRIKSLGSPICNFRILAAFRSKIRFFSSKKWRKSDKNRSFSLTTFEPLYLLLCNFATKWQLIRHTFVKNFVSMTSFIHKYADFRVKKACHAYTQKPIAQPFKSEGHQKGAKRA